MSKFIYKGTLNEKYVAGTILSDNVEANKVSVNTLDSTRENINVLKNVSIDGDLSVSGDINIEDIEIDTINTKTINAKNGNNIIKIYDNSIEISKDNGTNWTNLIKSGTGTNSVVFGNRNNIASGSNSFCEGEHNGSNWGAFGERSHCEGYQNYAQGNNSHAEGYRTTSKYNAHAEGANTTASGDNSHAEGNNTTASGQGSHAEGTSETIASSQGSHAEGGGTKSTAAYAHSEGVYTTASGEGAHAEGYTAWANRNNDEIKTWASNQGSHAEGIETQAKNNGAHSEGNRTKATGTFSHAEGVNTIASGNYGSHAEGANNTASGWCSHAEGESTIASSNYSHAGGLYTISNTTAGTAIGKYNISGNNKLFVVGNGNADDERSDAFVVYDNGNILLNNNLFISGSGHSQFLTHANENTNDNANDTRAISNGDFNYIIIGDIINITIPLKSKDKFVSGFRSKHNLSTDFCDYYLINLDFNNIKTIFDTHYNASTSMFYAGSQCFSILTRPRVLKVYNCRASDSNYISSYQNGLTIIIDSQGPSSGIYAGDYTACYIENFDGFVDDQYLNITLKYVKLT